MSTERDRELLKYLLLVTTYGCSCTTLEETGFAGVGVACNGCKKRVLVEEVKRLRGKLEEIPSIVKKQWENNVGDWGVLPQEPCRFCRKVGGVIFQVNEGQKNLCDLQVVMCRVCGKDWIADSPLA